MSDLEYSDYIIIFKWCVIGVVPKKSVGRQNGWIVECAIIKYSLYTQIKFLTETLPKQFIASN